MENKIGKKFLLLATSLLLLFARGECLPVGNPAQPSLLCDGIFFDETGIFFSEPCFALPFGLNFCSASFRIGLYNDYVLNRHLEIDSSAAEGDIALTTLYTNGGVLTLNLGDRLDFFAVLGATNCTFETKAAPIDVQGFAQGNWLTMTTRTSYSYQLGLKLILFEGNCWTISAAGQYFHAGLSLNRVDIAGEFVRNFEAPMTWKEWQVSFGLSRQIGCFVPYLAGRFSRVKLDNHDFTANVVPFTPTIDLFLFDMQNALDWGYAVGISLVTLNKASFTLEWRGGSDQAYFLGGELRF